MKKCLIILTIMLLSTFAFADPVILCWDANSPAVEGYRLYQRTDTGVYDYSTPVWTGSETTHTVDVPEGKYAWVVRAFNGSQESGDSNEVVYTVEAQPAPIIYPNRPKQLIIQFGE